MYIEQYNLDNCMVDFSRAENASLLPKKLFEFFSIIPQHQFLPSFDPARRTPVTFATYRGNKLVFKNGLLRHFTANLAKYGVGVSFDPRLQESNKNLIIPHDGLDIDAFTEWCNEYYGESTYTPREHQVEAALDILKRRRSVSECCTRAGKTLITHIIFSYIIEKRKLNNLKTKCLMLVPSKLLSSQGAKDFVDYIESTKVVCLNESKEFQKAKEIAKREEVLTELIKENDIIITTYQTWRQYTNKFTKYFHTIFVDECHGSGANSYTSIINDVPQQAMLFGMTGTMPDDTIAKLKIEQNINYVTHSIKTDELQDLGLLCDLTIKLYDMEYDFSNANSPVRPDLERCIDYGVELLSYNEEKKDKDGNKYIIKRKPAYLIPLLNQPDRFGLFKTICEHINLTKKESGNASLLLRFEQGMARLCGAKKDMVKRVVDSIIEENKNSTILLLCTSVDYTVELMNDFNSIYKENKNYRIWRITGNVPAKQRTEIITTINSKKNDENIIDIIVGSYGTMSTGVTIPYLTDVVLVEGYKSGIFNNQSIGRALGRYEGKTHATIHDFADIFTYTKCLAKHRSDRLAIYQTGKKSVIERVSI